MENKKFNTPLLWIGCILFGAALVYIINVFDQEYKEKIIEGDNRLIVGEFDDVWMNSAGSEFLSYKYKIKDKEYRRTIYNLNYYYRCKDNKDQCRELKFFVLYLVEDPSKSLIYTPLDVTRMKELEELVKPLDISKIIMVVHPTKKDSVNSSYGGFE